MEQQPICCPFCGFTAIREYDIMLHLETVHPEDNSISPFIVQEDDAAGLAAALELSSHKETSDREESEAYASCPVEGCGEALLFTELESHIEMHAEEQDCCSGVDEDPDTDRRCGRRIKLDPGVDQGASFDMKLSYAFRNLGDHDEEERFEDEGAAKQASAKATWKELLKMPNTSSSKTTAMIPTSKKYKRLGKSELGPHANEKQMPSWLVKLLERDGETLSVNQLNSKGHTSRIKICPNMASGIVPVLAQLLEQDGSSQYSYLSDPTVKHISKLKKEGGFCGYRNIQMMSSYIIAAKSQGCDVLQGRIPTIFEIQDYIENAWDLGINSQGRVETGGIRGTRKYIGTPDAQAMFCSLGVACDAQGLKSRRGTSTVAYELLLQAVEQYYTNGCTDYNPKVRCTALPPIYFQHPGHSMTIVGFEKMRDNSRNLIVFDPMFHDAPNVLKFVDQTFRHRHPEDLLRAYRRGLKYLKKYSEFELLRLTPP